MDYWIDLIGFLPSLLKDISKHERVFKCRDVKEMRKNLGFRRLLPPGGKSYLPDKPDCCSLPIHTYQEDKCGCGLLMLLWVRGLSFFLLFFYFFFLILNTRHPPLHLAGILKEKRMKKKNPSGQPVARLRINTQFT